MEYDVWYTCKECDFGTPLVSQMREHSKSMHDIKPPAPEDMVWHVANEWADGLCNAKVWMENVRDGISTFEEALLAIQSDIDHARKVDEATVLKIKEMKNGC